MRETHECMGVPISIAGQAGPCQKTQAEYEKGGNRKNERNA